MLKAESGSILKFRKIKISEGSYDTTKLKCVSNMNIEAIGTP